MYISLLKKKKRVFNTFRKLEPENAKYFHLFVSDPVNAHVPP